MNRANISLQIKLRAVEKCSKIVVRIHSTLDFYLLSINQLPINHYSIMTLLSGVHCNAFLVCYSETFERRNRTTWYQSIKNDIFNINLTSKERNRHEVSDSSLYLDILLISRHLAEFLKFSLSQTSIRF